MPSGVYERPPFEERFWAKVDKTDGCWNWTGARVGASKHGGLRYGSMRVGEATHYAHRIAYELLVGPIPDGLTIDHLCENILCVKPEHLEAVPAEENVRRMQAKKETCRRGHPLTGKRDSRGQRICLACRNESNRQYRVRKKLQAA